MSTMVRPPRASRMEGRSSEIVTLLSVPGVPSDLLERRHVLAVVVVLVHHFLGHLLEVVVLRRLAIAMPIVGIERRCPPIARVQVGVFRARGRADNLHELSRELGLRQRATRATIRAAIRRRRRHRRRIATLRLGLGLRLGRLGLLGLVLAELDSGVRVEAQRDVEGAGEVRVGYLTQLPPGRDHRRLPTLVRRHPRGVFLAGDLE
mmetsp:Transcript_4025/g.12221  ORF Transcript_4025/g.12221 Transcript_4025/m.12221 type:complete len:206 (-) Transcript_4025:1480-2097(-)